MGSVSALIGAAGLSVRRTRRTRAEPAEPLAWVDAQRGLRTRVARVSVWSARRCR